MNATTVAVDLAKTVFELAISGEQGGLVDNDHGVIGRTGTRKSR